MIRSNLHITPQQRAALLRLSAEKNLTQAEIVRGALNWYLGLTKYAQETIDHLERTHPGMNVEQLIVWLLSRWRMTHERTDNRSEAIRLLRLICRELEIDTTDRTSIEAAIADGCDATTD